MLWVANMILKQEQDGSFIVSFLLIPEYSMLALVSAIEPLRVANRMLGRELFRWQLIASSGHKVEASNKLELQQYALTVETVETPKNLFICASFNPERYITQTITRWLQSLAKKGSLLGAIDTGCYFLAEANLLTSEPITLHWEAVPSFREKYPDQNLTYELFEIGDNLITCSGGSSTLDLMLYLIQAELGHDLIVKVCEQFIRSGIRNKDDQQRLDISARLKVFDQRLIKAIAVMEQHFEEPLLVAEVASQVHLSVRQLERLFRQHLKTSPSKHYLELRLSKAQQLLLNSDLAISTISLICGFSSSSHLSRSYLSFFGRSPRDERNMTAV